jgi:hypothetical protein
MNNPNYDNIDRWLFDYVEGNLSSNQESMLENYILNHPELEVDLDMWRMSNIKTSNAFVNDIQIAKKTANRKVFHFINTIGIVIILLIGRQIHEFDSSLSSEDGQRKQASIKLNTHEPFSLKNSMTQNFEIKKQNISTVIYVEPTLSNTQNRNQVALENLDYLESNQTKLFGSNLDVQKLMISEVSMDTELEKLDIHQITAFQYTKDFAFNEYETQEPGNKDNRSKQISFKNSAKKIHQ